VLAEMDLEFDPARRCRKARFCSAYERNPERTRERFTAEYEEVEGDPTAREILDEAASRC
jgi:hypothetical protein